MRWKYLIQHCRITKYSNYILPFLCEKQVCVLYNNIRKYYPFLPQGAYTICQTKNLIMIHIKPLTQISISPLSQLTTDGKQNPKDHGRQNISTLPRNSKIQTQEGTSFCKVIEEAPMKTLGMIRVGGPCGLPSTRMAPDPLDNFSPVKDQHGDKPDLTTHAAELDATANVPLKLNKRKRKRILPVKLLDNVAAHVQNHPEDLPIGQSSEPDVDDFLRQIADTIDDDDPEPVASEKKRKRSAKRKKRNRNKSECDDNENDGMQKNRRPNYFVSLQITNPEIHAGLGLVQQAVVAGDPRLQEALISLPTLHISLLVSHLMGTSHLHRAIAALEAAAYILRQTMTEPLTLNVTGVDNFRNSVIFASVGEGPELDRLTQIVETVEKCFQAEGLVSDGKAFRPHITLLKLSKARRLVKKGVRQVPPEFYEEFVRREFGSQTASTLQLCAMLKPKNQQTGYYHMDHSVSFDRKSPPDGDTEPNTSYSNDTKASDIDSRQKMWMVELQKRLKWTFSVPAT